MALAADHPRNQFLCTILFFLFRLNLPRFLEIPAF